MRLLRFEVSKTEIVYYIVLVILFTLVTSPNQFDEDSGPSINALWSVDETILIITLIEIYENPLTAVFSDGVNEIQLKENEWGTLSSRTFKVRIYPEDQRVWVVWKMESFYSHVVKSFILSLVIGVILVYLRNASPKWYRLITQ